MYINYMYLLDVLLNIVVILYNEIMCQNLTTIILGIILLSVVNFRYAKE